MNCLLVGPVQVLNVFVINRFKWEVINMKTLNEQSQAEFIKNALNKTGMWKINQRTIHVNLEGTSATEFLLARPAGTW